MLIQVSRFVLISTISTNDEKIGVPLSPVTLSVPSILWAFARISIGHNQRSTTRGIFKTMV